MNVTFDILMDIPFGWVQEPRRTEQPRYTEDGLQRSRGLDETLSLNYKTRDSLCIRRVRLKICYFTEHLDGAIRIGEFRKELLVILETLHRMCQEFAQPAGIFSL